MRIYVLALLPCLVAYGCGAGRATAWDKRAVDVCFQHKTGMVFPKDATVLNCSINDRDPGYDCWIFVSSQPFILPGSNIDVPGGDTGYKCIQVMLNGKSLGKQLGKTFRHSDWEMGDAEYRGLMVQTDSGYYIKLEQFPKKPSKQKTGKGSGVNPSSK